MHYFFAEYSPLKEAPKLSVANEDMNNNYQTVNTVVDLPNASGDTMDWKKKFEMKSAQFDEVSHVNWYLMSTLNKMEMEMQGHVSVIQELKSSIKVSFKPSFNSISLFFVFITKLSGIQHWFHKNSFIGFQKTFSFEKIA